MENQQNEWIEVTGEGSYSEVAGVVVAHLRLDVTESPTDVAEQDLLELKKTCIECCEEAGMKAEDIGNGDSDHWHVLKMSARDASGRLIICSRDPEVLEDALRSIEQRLKTKWQRVTLEMQEPVFEPSVGAMDKALQAAVGQAAEKALVLGRAAGRNIGRIVQIQETRKVVTEHSAQRLYESAIDEGYGRTSYVPPAPGSDAIEESLGKIYDIPWRKVTVEFMVRFELS